MKKEEIYVEIKNESDRTKAIQILTDAGEVLSDVEGELNFNNRVKFLLIANMTHWWISSNTCGCDEITLEQLEELLIPKKKIQYRIKTKEEFDVVDSSKYASENIIPNVNLKALHPVFKEMYEAGTPGKKETETNGVPKVNYSEINLDILDLMAQRMMANKHKYPEGNSKKELNIKDLEWALFRHLKKMIKPIKGDEESYRDHLSAILCNASMILDQLELRGE